MVIVSEKDIKKSPYYNYKPCGFIDGKQIFEETFNKDKYEKDLKLKEKRQKIIDNKKEINLNSYKIEEEFNIDLIEEEKINQRKLNKVPKVEWKLEEPDFFELQKKYLKQDKKQITTKVENPVIKKIDLNKEFDLITNYRAPFSFSYKIDSEKKLIIVSDEKNNKVTFPYSFVLNFANIEMDILSFRETEKETGQIHDYFYSISTKKLIKHKKSPKIYNMDPDELGGSESARNFGLELVLYTDEIITNGLASVNNNLGISTGPGRFEIDNEPQYVFNEQYNNSNSGGVWYQNVEPFRTDNWWQNKHDFSATDWSKDSKRCHLIGDNVLIASANADFFVSTPTFLPKDGGDPVSVTINQYVQLPNSGLRLALLNEPADPRINRCFLWPYEITPNLVFNGRSLRVVQDFTSPTVNNTQKLGTSVAARMVPGQFKELLNNGKTFKQNGVTEYNDGSFNPPADGYFLNCPLGDNENATYALDKFSDNVFLVSLYDDGVGFTKENEGVYLGSQTVKDEIDAQLATWGVSRNKYFTGT